MPTLEHLQAAGTWFFGLVVAIGVTIGQLRTGKKKDDTTGKVEDAKQASAQVYINQLAATATELERTRERANKDADSARDREKDLRTINDQVRGQFVGALDEFRSAHASSDERIGVLIEDVAEWRGRAEALQAEKIDLQAAIQRQISADNEARRALTSSYESTIASLRTENAGLQERNHALVNQAYGDGTATNILGPRE